MAAPDIDALLGQMTLDEKIMLLAGKNFWETREIERLQIPSLKVSDGPNGARGKDFVGGKKAACFPCSTSLAATFDTELSRRVGKALAEEAQTKGAYVLLGPTACGHRSPLGGRNFESFSEDPLLSGLMAAEYVKGLQSERVAATIKHFVANEQETRRFVVDQKISERALREIYLKPFEIVVKTADPWAVMSCYPKVNGFYMDGTTTFLTDTLRKQWGFDGLVMSDWGGCTTVEGVKNGLDLEMPGPGHHRTPEKVKAALKEGRLTEADIDACVRNNLVLLKKTGKFTDRRETPEEQAIIRPDHQALIREAGGAGIVLLKNEDAVLPVDTTKKKKIALLGPLAKQASAHGGGSASLNCHYKISPFEALSARLGKDVELTYCKGCHIFRAYPDLTENTINSRGNPGYLIEYIADKEAKGAPVMTAETTRSYFSTHDDKKAREVAGSARGTTTFRPTVSGRHYLSLSGAGPTQLFINGKLVAEQTGNITDGMAFVSGTQDEQHFQYAFEAGKAYEIRIDSFLPTASVSDAFFLDNQIVAHLGFVPEQEMEGDLEAEAAQLAREADVAIVFVGNTYQWESEGLDMEAMVLPPYNTHEQDRLVKAVAAAAGKEKTIVVAATGVPIALPWLDDVGALMQAWYGGQETGNAIADVLLGTDSPSGKLPSSWPRRIEDTACFGHFGLDSMESREVEYVEGVFTGYRHFDRLWGTERAPLFPFGYGLSYSEFSLSGAALTGSITKADAGLVSVSVTVTNTGSFGPAAEVVQVYLAPPRKSATAVDRPVKELAGFTKTGKLSVGAKETVNVSFGRDVAAFWDEAAACWSVAAGTYEVIVATSSNPADVKATLPFIIAESFTYAA